MHLVEWQTTSLWNYTSRFMKFEHIMTMKPRGIVNTHHLVDFVMRVHSEFMTKTQVGHGDKSCSNLGWLRIDQDSTKWSRLWVCNKMLTIYQISAQIKILSVLTKRKCLNRLCMPDNMLPVLRALSGFSKSDAIATLWLTAHFNHEPCVNQDCFIGTGWRQYVMLLISVPERS